MNKTKKLVFTALIAAAYAVTTLVIAPLSFGAVQLRISEALETTSFGKCARLATFIP